jgi:hypothetical protein
VTRDGDVGAGAEVEVEVEEEKAKWRNSNFERMCFFGGTWGWGR